MAKHWCPQVQAYKLLSQNMAAGENIFVGREHWKSNMLLHQICDMCLLSRGVFKKKKLKKKKKKKKKKKIYIYIYMSSSVCFSFSQMKKGAIYIWYQEKQIKIAGNLITNRFVSRLKIYMEMSGQNLKVLK